MTRPRGDYGSPYSETSIHNPLCPYGGDKGSKSPFNPNCFNPPIVFYRNKPLFVLTTNVRFNTDGLKIIDPYLLLAIYEAMLDVVPSPVPQASSKSKLIRIGPTHEQLMEKLVPLSGSAFSWVRTS